MTFRAAVALILVVGCNQPDRVERWIRDLRSEDAMTRSYAAARLGEIRHEPRLPYHLLPIGSGPLPLRPNETRIIAALNDLLIEDDSIDGGPRLSAITALAQLRPPGPQPGLMHCIVHDVHLDTECMDVLIRIGEPAVIVETFPLLLATRPRGSRVGTVADTVRAGLQQCGDALGPAIREVLEVDDDVELERAVIHDLLRTFGGDMTVPTGSIELLEIALRSRFAEVRYQALDAIADLGLGEARTAVLALTEDPNLDVRTKAAAILDGRPWDRTQEREVESPP